MPFAHPRSVTTACFVSPQAVAAIYRLAKRSTVRTYKYIHAIIPRNLWFATSRTQPLCRVTNAEQQHTTLQRANRLFVVYKRLSCHANMLIHTDKSTTHEYSTYNPSTISPQNTHDKQQACSTTHAPRENEGKGKWGYTVTPIKTCVTNFRFIYHRHYTHYTWQTACEVFSLILKSPWPCSCSAIATATFRLYHLNVLILTRVLRCIVPTSDNTKMGGKSVNVKYASR